MPDRLLRAAVLARFADVLNGTAAVRRETVQALVGMLGGPMPYVPERGHGDPGNNIALGHLLRPVFTGRVEIGENMALIDGSPFASAVLADGVLAGRTRLAAAVHVEPELSPPHGDVLSNGGYHHPFAVPCLDALARSWADLAQLVTAQEARSAAQTTVTGLGPSGRTDTSTGEMLACRRCRDAGDALEAGLAVLAVHTMAHRSMAVPPALRSVADAVLDQLPVDTEPAGVSGGLTAVRNVLRDLPDLSVFHVKHRGVRTARRRGPSST